MRTYLGIDVGSVSSQAVIMTDGQIYAYGNMRTGSNSPDSARNALKFALENTSLTEDKIHYFIGTGYGRVNVPMADRTVTEIACHARGANFIYGPQVRTVLDVGGQDIKAIRCDDKGKVTNFLMNDKCAASSGRYLENMAAILEVSLAELSSHWEDPVRLDATCGIFGESELIGQILRGHSVARLCAGVNDTLVRRVLPLLRRFPSETIVLTGGVAYNSALVRILERETGLEIVVPPHPQHNGAIGCATL